MEDDDDNYPSDQELFGSEETNLSTDFSTYSEESGLGGGGSGFDLEDYELRLMKGLKKALSGIPPPPSVTIPTQDFNDVVTSWNSFIETQPDGKQRLKSSGNSREPHLMSTLGDVLTRSWPEIKNCHFYDVNYNRTKYSETLACLYDKYQERFVGYETSSFMTINSPTKSIIKKSPNRDKHLSDRTASYLAKRRKTFSMDGLESMNKTFISASNKAKNRLIIDPMSVSKNTKLRESTNRFANSNTGFRRSLLDSCSNDGTNMVECKYGGSALSEMTASLSYRQSSKPDQVSSPYKNRTARSNERTPRKRRSSSNDENCQFSPFKKSRVADSNRRSAETSDKQKTNENNLNRTQKMKLLWAVSDALKSVGIGSRHALFKSCGQQLFKLCVRLWVNSNAVDRNVELGVTDRMIALAREHAKEVVSRVQMQNRNFNPDLFSDDSSSCDSFFAEQREFFASL